MSILLFSVFWKGRSSQCKFISFFDLAPPPQRITYFFTVLYPRLYFGEKRCDKACLYFGSSPFAKIGILQPSQLSSTSCLETIWQTFHNLIFFIKQSAQIFKSRADLCNCRMSMSIISMVLQTGTE